MPMGNQPENYYESPLLSQVGSMYRNRDLIADRVLTVVPVPKMTFKYIEWDQGSAYDLENTIAVPRASANQIELKGTKKDGTCDVHFLSDMLDPLEMEQAGGEVPLSAISAEVLTAKLMLRREKTVADKLTDPAVVTANTTLVGAQQWSDDTSDPQKEVQGRADSMPNKPNIFVCGVQVHSKLRTHAKVRNAIAGMAMPDVTDEWLAKYLGVEEIIVGGASYNSAAKGQPRVRAAVWGKDAFLAYRAKTPPSPLMDQPTAGYMPVMGSYVPGSAEPRGRMHPVRVYTARLPNVGTGEGVLYIKAETSYQVLISSPDNIFLWKAAVA